MYEAPHTQRFPSVCGKRSTSYLGGIRTHDLLLTSTDILISRPPSLPMTIGRLESWVPRYVYIYEICASAYKQLNKFIALTLTYVCILLISRAINIVVFLDQQQINPPQTDV